MAAYAGAIAGATEPSGHVAVTNQPPRLSNQSRATWYSPAQRLPRNGLIVIVDNSHCRLRPHPGEQACKVAFDTRRMPADIELNEPCAHPQSDIIVPPIEMRVLFRSLEPDLLSILALECG